MPPVRWKSSFVVSAFLLLWTQQFKHATAAKMEKFSMSEDGWRPIIGSHREHGLHDEITHYRNPASKKSEAVKAEKPNKLFSSALSFDATSRPQATTVNNLSVLGLGSKIPPHSKPMIMMQSHGAHGPQIPLGPMMHRPVKYGHVVKMHPHKRHKPVRMQIPAYSNRDEVFVPAPSSNIGPYTFYTPGPSPVKTRISQQHQHQLQPQQHNDYTNHFSLQNQQDDIYQVLRSPIQQYVLPKHPIQNDVHYSFQTHDDYNRNLVPPPFKYVQEKEKKAKPFKENVEPVAPKPPHGGGGGVLVQVSPPIQYNTLHNQPQQQSQHHQQHQYSHVQSQKKKEQAIDIQVTKEKFKVFQSTTPSFAPLEKFEKFEFHTFKSPSKLATYEVTEGKHWQETPPYIFHYSTRNPAKNRRPVSVFTEDSKPFLPTPIKPETAAPTAPTESEVSTIYNQIAKLNRLKERERVTPMSFFDIKEVSTHFPIVGLPEYQEYPTRFAFEAPQEEFNEITTKNVYEKPSYVYDDIEVDTTTTTTTSTTTTPKPTTLPPSRPMRKRPNQRRRRPTARPTTTTEVPEVTEFYEAQKTESSAEEYTERSRGRRPMRYRTTTPTYEEEYSTRTRHRRPRPTTEEPKEESAEVPDNHKTNYVEPTVETFTPIEERIILRSSTEKEFPANFESQFKMNSDEEEYERPNMYYNTPPNREDKRRLEDSGEVEPVTPENEIDYTISSTQPTTLKIETTFPIETTTSSTTTTPSTTTTRSTTTTTTTTTTPAPTTASSTTEVLTVRSHRIRTRPVKYDNSNRPRFSVKEYRQRLTSTSTSTTTTEVPKSSTYPESMRNRFPHRSRRPITTIGHSETEEQSTEPIRGKFVPKDARHANGEPGNTERPAKSVNSRVRPFGRFKPTTESPSSTARVSIKPHIFGNLRRPTPISLRNRIMNKQRSTSEKPETTTDEDSLEETNETDMSEIVESTVPYQVDSTTEFGAKVTVDVETGPKKPQTDILKNEDFMQSQIVSDLTSSSKNEYNKPGVFKNVSPTSRKVPSYFTLATDDPILPIEAFFPNLKDKQ